MSKDTTAEEVLKLLGQAIAARQRTKARYLFDSPAVATRAIQKLKIFDSYAQASCRYMCQEILRSLPPELCDMIIVRVIGHDNGKVNADHTCEPIYTTVDRQPPKHYWKVEYVGKLMLAKMIKIWYRINSFMVSWRNAYLRTFLNEVAPCLHLPRYKFITKISVTIWPDHTVWDEKRGRGTRTGIFWHMPTATWENLIEDLESLFRLRSGSSIHILVRYPEGTVFSGNAYRDSHPKDLLLKGTAPILASLSRLRNAGYVLGVSICVGEQPLRLEDTFEYSLDENGSLDRDSGNVPAGDAGLVWRYRFLL